MLSILEYLVDLYYNYDSYLDGNEQAGEQIVQDTVAFATITLVFIVVFKIGDKLLKYFGINLSEIFNPERYKSEHGNGSGGDAGGNGYGESGTGNGSGGNGETSGGGSSSVPDKAKQIANYVKNNNGTPPEGYKGGRTYKNIPLEDGAQKLPEGVNYREYDVNPYIKGQNRGAERIVIGDDGSVWYTNDHYFTFIRIE